MIFRPKRTLRTVFSFGLFSLLLLPFLPTKAYPFADNNVRIARFKWMHVQTEHFDIYFDKSTERLVPRMAHYLESAWKDVGRAFSFQVPGRTPFFFYSTHNEFEQTNIVPIGEGTGGVTEAFKNRLLIFNDGSEEWLRHVIYHEFTHVVQFNILYGGFWKSVRLLKSPFYPLWGMEGTAEYGSGDIDAVTGDMVVRDAVAHHQLPLLAELQGFGHLKPNQVTLGYKTGEAAAEFMKDEYGEEKFKDFLPVLKDHFDVSSALENTVGADLNRFDFRFHEYMDDKYNLFIKNSKSASTYGLQLTKPDGIPQFNEAPVVSPDGKKVYYFSDRGGPTQLFEYDLETGKAHILLPLKYKLYENIETRGRALSISPDGKTLAFSAEKKQHDFLYLFDLEKKKATRVKIPFDQLKTPVFSPVDDQLVAVGMMRGFNDLYLINRQGKVIERLTDNPQDEKDPVFTPDGKLILFAGEVLKDDQSSPAGRDIFSYDLQTHRTTALTSMFGSELEPEPLPDGSIVFVRDRDDEGHLGFNLYHLNVSTPSVSQRFITNVVGGGFSPRYSAATNSLFFIGFENGEKHIYQGTWTFLTDMAQKPVGEPRLAFADDIPLRDHQPQFTWPADSRSPLFVSPVKPYRFKSSTDLFLPFFLYSTQDGLVVVDLWQYSELFGNHQFQQQMQYASGNDLFDLSLVYTYARFRPQFSIGLRGQKYFRDFQRENQRREVNLVGVMSYPFDRINSLQLGMGGTDRRDTFLDESEENSNFRDRFVIAGFEYDTVTGRYLVPTKGQRLNLFYQQGFNAAGGDQEYKSGGLEAVQYVPFPRESTWASRAFYGRSVGQDPQVFRLGGVDRVRGLPGGIDANKKSNVAFASSEMRLRIKYLNARTKFLFPDFFFKAAYLIMFDDVGYGWDNEAERKEFQPRRLENSAGLGISWPTFILQTFQLNLTVQWAKRTNVGEDVWYITVAPSF